MIISPVAVFKSISWFLGIAMLMFGILKFADPFKSWYAVQIAASGLGNTSYIMGIAGEIAAGCLLIASLVFRYKMRIILPLASLVIIIMMLPGIYVHLHPDVPAGVLPLKIKPPYIPGGFLLLSVINMLLVRKYAGLVEQVR